VISNIIAGLALAVFLCGSTTYYAWLRDRRWPKALAALGALMICAIGSLALGGAGEAMTRFECADSHAPGACIADADD
jgi:hypothetical protein